MTAEALLLPVLAKPKSHFTSQATPLCGDTLTLLRRLGREEGTDIVGRAVADVLAATALAAFAKSHQVTQRHGWHTCVRRLLGRRCHSPCPHIPAGDHRSEWCRGRETVAIVSQPYGLQDKELHDTMAFCAEYGLSVSINVWPGWHFPGRALFVVFTRQGFLFGETPP